MSDTINDPQPIDPPVGTGGSGGTQQSNTTDTEIDDEADAIDPPVSTGGGGAS